MNTDELANELLQLGHRLSTEGLDHTTTVVASDVVGQWFTDQESVRQAAEYAARTGHRLVLDYKNPHGHHTENRKIAVTKVRSGGHLGRTYIDAVDLKQNSPRTFILDRVTRAKLDG